MTFSYTPPIKYRGTEIIRMVKQKPSQQLSSNLKHDDMQHLHQAHALRLSIAQLNFTLGDIAGNTQLIINHSLDAYQQHSSDIILFPELAITAYPPEDLLLRSNLYQQVDNALQQICDQTQHITSYLVIGHPRYHENAYYNSASIIYRGKIIACYDKHQLPNYRVFDEKRYFTAGNQLCMLTLNNIKVGILICEDVWFDQPIKRYCEAGAQLLLSINASPFHTEKLQQRHAMLKQRAQETKIPIVYANCVGGQDELIFDGSSFIVNQHAEVVQQLPQFQTIVHHTLLDFTQTQEPHIPSLKQPTMLPEVAIYQALVMGTHDYLHKNNITGALVGLSGGIDSALTLAIAVDALGKDNVHAVMLPARYTSELSLTAARDMAKILGVQYDVISIEPAFEAFLTMLEPAFARMPADNLTEQNIQARCRGLILMALSNKTGKLVLTTSNKSEIAVGYSTLYGDMAGGFAVLKDVYKTTVYRLCNYRNQLSTQAVIPQVIIDRPPSAELAPNQTDQDSLPEYPILDAIIQHYVEHDRDVDEIVTYGFDKTTVQRVIQLIDRNEYKRRQSPPGVRISARAFGRDWRYPLTSRYHRQTKTN
ncbi:MAG: NAD+ synthase [Gammaproteobacteria bacterium]